MPKRKKDWAEQQTDKQIEELEEEIYKEYKEAYENVKKKYDEYSKQLLENDAKKQKQLADGEITEDDYKKWKVQQLMVGSRWKALETNLAQDLTMVDKKAMSIVNGYLPEAYALNFNYSTYELEEGINIDTSFTLYSRETVERLFREGEIELPKGKVDIPEDMKWNKKHITSAIMQGILSGDDIPTIGERLQQVTDMDRRGAIRNARTLMTGAQNSGRIDAYGRIADMGVEVKKQWLATLDHRTRDSHQELDGQIVDLDKKFSNGLLYPGDPHGEGSEVYNCRCTLVPFFPKYDTDDWDFERHDQLHRKDIKYTTYKEWAKAKKSPNTTYVFDSNKLNRSRFYYVNKKDEDKLSKEEIDDYVSLAGANKFTGNINSYIKVKDLSTGLINIELESENEYIKLMLDKSKDKCYIDLIHIMNKQQGKGTEILKEITEQAYRMGFTKVTAICAGDGEIKKSDEDYAGYYVLAKFGFDAELRPEQLEKVRKAGFKDVFTVQDMMKTEERRKWWKAHGSVFNGTYWLKPRKK